MKAYTDANGFVTTQKPKVSKSSLAVLQRSIKPVDWFSDEELMQVPAGEVFVFDTECYVNFWYCAFKQLKSGKVVAFEQSPDHQINTTKLLWMLWRFCLVGFNIK